MTTGEKSGQWGDITNTNLSTILEQAVAGTSEISITGSGGSIILTTSNGSADQAREAVLHFTGTYSSGTVNVIAPASSKIYLVVNDSDQTVRIKTTTSTGITVASGQINFIVFNTTALDFQLASAQVTGYSTNVPNTLVQRDGSGNFAAGTITASGLSMGGGTVSSPKFQAYNEAVNVVGNVSGSVSVDLSVANIFSYTLTGNTTFSFTNPPASGTSKPFTLIIRQDSTGSRSASFTGAKWTDGTAPTLTTTPSRYDVFTFFTIDGGVSYFATYAMANVS
jgi:hypothetical protein